MIIRITFFFDPVTRYLVRFFIDIMLVNKINRLAVRVIIASDKRIRIWVPTKVSPLINHIHPGYFVIGNFAQLQKLKYVSTCPNCVP